MLRQPDPPGKLVEMGRISAPFGIKGWVKIQHFVSGGAASLKNYPAWFVEADGVAGADEGIMRWQQTAVEATEVHGDHLVAKLAGCSDRDAAALLKGRVIAVPREAFAPAAAGEYYWADLIGLAVRNTEGQALGAVAAMLETGANDVMVVRLSDTNVGKDGERDGQERLIPFITSVIKRVDVANSVIEVDWGLDY